MPVGISRPVWGHLIITMPILILPVSLLCRSNVSVRHRLDCTSSRGRRLFQPIPAVCKSFDSVGFLQDSGEALLDRLGRLGRDFLSELPKFLVLRGRDFEVLAALRGRQLYDFR